ncbi:MAG: KH domain-containing protein [Eggerthellaceae bacterium]|jgi:predicted RNA-binding protein YlqC (UPF0109 family)
MAGQTEELIGLVDCIVRPLVDNPDDLVIEANETDDGTVRIEISVNEEDVGKVIGRQGRVIKSIRTLARAAAARSNERVEVEVLE